MNQRDIVNLRLISQHLTKTDLREPAQVVSALGALQAQDYQASLWAIGLRTQGCNEADVKKAVADGVVVRTWIMRGTLHFATAKDVHWMLELLGPGLVAGRAGRHRQLKLDAADFKKSQDFFADALHGKKRMTRDQLYSVLESGGISTKGQRGYHMLWRAGLDGVICFGPHAGKQPTFVLLNEWVPRTASLTREEALQALARLYFCTRGPATLQDFVWWSGLRTIEAKAGLNAVASEIKSTVVGEKIFWTPKNQEPLNDALSATLLLPAFDEYIVSYRDRSALLRSVHRSRVSNNGMFYPTIVVDGCVVGNWKKTTKKNQATVQLLPFGNLASTEKHKFTEAAERYGAFLGLKTSIS